MGGGRRCARAFIKAKARSSSSRLPEDRGHGGERLGRRRKGGEQLRDLHRVEPRAVLCLGPSTWSSPSPSVSSRSPPARRLAAQ